MRVCQFRHFGTGKVQRGAGQAAVASLAKAAGESQTIVQALRESRHRPAHRL